MEKNEAQEAGQQKNDESLRGYPDLIVDEAYLPLPGNGPLPDTMMCIYAGPDFFNPPAADSQGRPKPPGMYASQFMQQENVQLEEGKVNGPQASPCPDGVCPCCGIDVSAYTGRFCSECGAPLKPKN